MTDYNPIVLNYLSKEEKKVLMEGKLDEKEKVMQSYHIRMSDITMENVQQESNKLRGLLGDHCWVMDEYLGNDVVYVPGSSFYLSQPKPESYFKDKCLEMIAEQTELIKLIQTAPDIKAVQQYCFEKGLNTVKDVML